MIGRIFETSLEVIEPIIVPETERRRIRRTLVQSDPNLSGKKIALDKLDLIG
jgi:hypothetical protein